MEDLAAFAEEGFDPKAWINAQCAAQQRAAAAAQAQPPSSTAAAAAAAAAGGAAEPPPQQQLERFLAELEMRLQLGGEEVEAALSELSAAALRRVPFAQQEVARLRGDVAALQATAAGLLASVAADAGAAKQAAAPLAALHTARTNMEAGCATLREAAELAGAFARVEEVFAAGDLPRVAEMLRSMARSLALVGGVPEFRDARGRLAALEDRLQRQVVGRLSDAFVASGGGEVAALAGLLLAVGRGASVRDAYVSSRLPLVGAMWEEAAAALAGQQQQPPAAQQQQQQQQGKSAAGAAAAAAAGGIGGGWLLLLYNSLLSLLEADAAWLSGCLPAQRPQLLGALIEAAFGKLNPLIASKLAGAPSTRVLAGLLGDAAVAARRLRELLAAVDGDGAGGAGGGGGEGAAAAAAAAGKDGQPQQQPQQQQLDATRLLRLALEPLEAQGAARFVPLEEQALSSKLAAPLLPPGKAGAGDDDGGGVDADVAKQLDAASAAAFAALGGVVERCVLLTGGTELPAALAMLDKAAAGHLQRATAAVGIVAAAHARAASAAADGGGGGGSGGGDVSAVLQLLLLSRHVTARLSGLEAALRSAVTTHVPRLQQLAAAGLPPLGQQPNHHHHHHAAAGPAVAAAAARAGIAPAAAAAAAELLPLRLLCFPERLAPLPRLQAAAAGSRFMCLPSANAAGAALADAVAAAVRGALLAPVAAALAPLPALPEWAAAAPGLGAAGGGGAFVQPGAGASVPAFSAYPLAAVTGVGEYLMALPQQLEVLMSSSSAPAAAAAAAGSGGHKEGEDGDATTTTDGAAADGGGGGEGEGGNGGDDEGDELAAEWLDRAVRGAGAAYVEAVLRIPRLSPAGGAQLAADAEYLANVMSALAVPPPPGLVAAQLLAAAPADAFARLADGAAVAAAAAGSAANDARVLRAIAAMRGIEWSEEAALAAAAAAAAGGDAGAPAAAEEQQAAAADAAQ